MGPKPSGPSFRRYVNQSGERDPHELISTRLPTPGGPGPGPGPGSVSQAGNLPEGFTATFTSRYIDTGQLRLHAVIGGDGPPLLLVHGWPETWYAWRLVMPALARDYQVVAVDLRAIGLSDKPQDGYDTGTQVGDMVALMDALGHQRFAMIDAARALELGGGPGSLELAGWAAYSKRDYELAARGMRGRPVEALAAVEAGRAIARHHHQRFLSLSAQHALAIEDPDRAASLASGVVTDAHHRPTLRYSPFARMIAARARLAVGDPIDHDELDSVLAELEQCAGLEAWRVTAEVAAAAGVDRWWREAERRAGALVVGAGEHGETLRRYVATTFAALGRGRR